MRTLRGVAGNRRLTATTGVVLLVLLGVQVGTVVAGVKHVLPLHEIVGLLATPIIGLKIGSIGWRFARYYRGDAAYRRSGPPRLLARLLGPFLLTATVVMIGTGLFILLNVPARVGPLEKVHAFSAYAWIVLALLHVALHAKDVAHLALRDWWPKTRRVIPGAVARDSVLVGALLVGLVLAWSFSG